MITNSIIRNNSMSGATFSYQDHSNGADEVASGVLNDSTIGERVRGRKELKRMKTSLVCSHREPLPVEPRPTLNVLKVPSN